MRIRVALLFAVVNLMFSTCLWAEPQTQYLAIFIDGQRCGYAVHNRVASEQTVRTTERVVLTITRFGVPVTVVTVETSIETIDGKPIGFEAIQDMSMWRTTMSGAVSSDGKVKATSVTGQLKQEKNFEWPKGALMAEGLRLLEKEKGLAEGAEYSAKVFSPSMLQAVDTKVSIGGRKEVNLPEQVMSLTEVTSRTNMFMAGEVESTSYVDDEFNTLKTITSMMGMQLEMAACSQEFALSEAAPADIIDKAFVASPRPLAGIESAKLVRYRIRPKDNARDLKIPSNDNQKARSTADGTVVVTVKPIRMPARARFGYSGQDAEILEALRPNRFVQSDDEKIRQLAKEAIGKTNNAGKAAKRIESFVADYIEGRTLSVGYASAAEVADSRQGDCTEFAVLTAALCRAAGIPARIVVGVAYVDEFMGFENVFGGHAWTEAYIGGRWVGLDAAFKAAGRGGYDAGHIALAAGSGNLEDYFSLLFTIGQFEIEDVRVER